MKLKDVIQWLTLGALILGAGIWLGKLQQQVSDMQRVNTYMQGEIQLPPKGS